MNSELKRIRDKQAAQLSSLTASLTTNPPQNSSTASESQRDPNSLAAHLSSPFYQDTSTRSGAKFDAKEESDRSHDSVQKEIMDLRKKLDGRKKVEKMSPEVEKAKEKLVACLRTNDRRPLDCWEEVEKFKAEVGRMERVFIEQASR